MKNDFYRKPTSTPRPAGEVPSRPERVAKQFLYEGAFNVNSTSKEAWRLMLTSLRGVDTPGTSVFSRFGIPPKSGGRMLMGFFGLTLLIGAEIAMTRAMRGLSPEQWLAHFASFEGAIYALLLACFAAMPWLRR